MGKEIRGVPEEPALSRGGVGHYLASQRRLREISLDDLARLTKIPRRSLERLEAGVFDHASDGFVRGFVRAVAVSLGLDPDEAVMRLMVEPEEASPVSRFGLPSGKWLVRVALFAGVAVVAAGLWWLVSLWLAPATPAQPGDVFLRRDPVRSLAGEAEPQPVSEGDTPAVAP